MEKTKPWLERCHLSKLNVPLVSVKCVTLSLSMLRCHSIWPFGVSIRKWPFVVRRSASYLLVRKRRVGSDPSDFPRSTQGEGARPCSFPGRSRQKIEPVGRAVNSREVNTLRVHIRSLGTVRSLDTVGESPWRKTGLAWIRGLAACDSAQNKKGPNNEQELD